MNTTSNYTSDERWDALNESSKLFSHLCEEVLPQHLYECRWFGGKGGNILMVAINDCFHLQDGFRHYYLLVLEVFFKESFAHHYFLPLAVTESLDDLPQQARLMDVQLDQKSYHLIDALYDEGFHHGLFANLITNHRVVDTESSIDFKATETLKEKKPFQTELLKAEQSNSTIVIQEQYYLKIFRRLFRDKNPDFEINEYLSTQRIFNHYPALAGLISWQTQSGLEISLGLMQKKVENQGDAWSWMLNQLKTYFSKASKQHLKAEEVPMLNAVSINAIPEHLKAEPGIEFFHNIQQLAQRTAEMHIALGAERRDRNFVPSSYNSDFTVWLKNRLIYQFEARYNVLNKKYDSLPPEAREMAVRVMKEKDFMINFILSFDEEMLQSQRIRIHGDYHLGQILMQDNDFIILDFEGEPESTIRDRKVKQSPLKDVAGLFRSFHYAIFATHFEDTTTLPTAEVLQLSTELYRTMVGTFLDRYYALAFDNNLDIGYKKEINYLLQYFLLEKAIYELGYELNGRPSWAIIPLRGILEIIEEIKLYEQQG